MRKQENYWSFRAPDTPEFNDLPVGTFDGTEAGWDSLFPGYQREIYKSLLKKVQTEEEDLQRLARADLKHKQGMISILAREAL